MNRQLMVRGIPVLIGAVVVGVIAMRGCEQGPFGRNRVITLSPEEEVQLGAQAFREVLQKERVVREAPIVDVVQRVASRIARASEDPELREAVGLKEMKFDWAFRVVDSPQINAFCLPGGKVVVYTGILPVCYDEDGLATVLGHEIAHALARHGAERMAQHQMVSIGQQALAASLGGLDPQQYRQVMGLLGAGATVGILLPFSRDHESEADHIGLLLMAKAGYDPVVAPEFWQRMKKATERGQRQPEFLSTHPSPDTRINDLRNKWMNEADKLYKTSDKQPSRKLPLGRTPSGRS